jgi:hypothetical protein
MQKDMERHEHTQVLAPHDPADYAYVTKLECIALQCSQCAHRLVRCVYSDCEYSTSATIPAHMLRHHLRYECASPTRKHR